MGVALLWSCAGPASDFNPFYLSWSDADTGRADSVAFGPLFDDAVGPGEREVALHPLWRSVRTDESHEVQVLDPLFNWRTTAERTEFRFLALMWWKGHHAEFAAPEWDFHLYPLLFLGSGPPGDNYFALLPLIGSIESFAGYRNLFFLLFPLYYRVTKDIFESETFHSITPLIGWTSGGPRDDSYRFLPLFGKWSWKGKYERYSFLWPLFHYQRLRLDQPDPATHIAFWPLFQIEESRLHRFITVLWPFFRWNTETVPERPELPAEQYHRYDFLWPLYRWERNREFERLRVFPFFSRYRSEEMSSDAFAIPFFWRREERREDWVKNTFDIVPIVHHEKRRYRDGRPGDQAFKLWPLFEWEATSEGAGDFAIPALFPLERNQYTADFQANWGPLFQLYRDRENKDERRIQALFRLLEYRREKDRSRWSIPLLYSGEHFRGRTRHDLLLGLIRFGHGQGGGEFRLLYLPLWSPDPNP